METALLWIAAAVAFFGAQVIVIRALAKWSHHPPTSQH